MVIGFAGAAFKTERHVELRPGAVTGVGSYDITYTDLERDVTPEKRMFAAHLSIARDGDVLGTLVPQRNFHVAQRQWQSEVAIRTTPIEDLYLVITSFDRDGTASLRAFVNPLTWWIWIGAGLMASGMIFILAERAPTRVAVRSVSPAREVAVATR